MVSISPMMLCAVLMLVGVSQAGHICNNGIHYFVEHTMQCPSCRRSSFLQTGSKSNHSSKSSDSCAEAEMLGCNLFDFAAGKRFNRMPDQQVHWPGGAEGLEDFEYTEHRNVPGHKTCLTRSNCDADGKKWVHYYGDDQPTHEYCYGTTHEEFNMPDYCSRAITSELSTVYNGVDRTTSLRSGAKVLFASADKRCFWSRNIRGKKAIIRSILGKGHTEKACWNHANDWRLMYCVKYNECKCPKGLTPEECSLHAPSVNCCKQQYQEFLDSEYNVYKGYPLKKECQQGYGSGSRWGCEFNPAWKNQSTFERSAAQDFSSLY